MEVAICMAMATGTVVASALSVVFLGILSIHHREGEGHCWDTLARAGGMHSRRPIVYSSDTHEGSWWREYVLYQLATNDIHC
jgi:hypothetical protein